VNAASVPSVLLVDWHAEDDIRPRVGNSGVWRQAKENNQPRWHYFQAARIGAQTGEDSGDDRREVGGSLIDFQAAGSP
jgi:hypothetical protein